MLDRFGGTPTSAALPNDPRSEDGTIRCWETRGCAGVAGIDGSMEDECPHNVPDRYSPCPATCAFTRCQRPWHAEAENINVLLDPTVDRMQAIKEQCRHCLYFIKHGPRVSGAVADGLDGTSVRDERQNGQS